MVLPYGVVPIGPQPSLSPFPVQSFVSAGPYTSIPYSAPPPMPPPFHHGYDYPDVRHGERDIYDDEEDEPYYDDYQDHVEQRSRSPRRPFEGTPADPRSRSPNQRRAKSPVTNRQTNTTRGEEDAFSLALSEVTTVRPDHLYMTLPEEMMLLKAGDNPKFSKKNKVMDQQCAAALLLELVWQGRVGPDPHFSVDPQRLVLKVLDDTPTGSKLVDSAISNLKRKPKHPPTVAWWLEKASPDLAASILWRLVKKNKVTYDPRTFGADRYPIKSFADLNAVRERVVQAVDQRLPAAVRDMFLAFLYYLPEDSSEKVFGDREDNGAEDGRLLGKALVFAMRDNTRGSKNWI